MSADPYRLVKRALRGIEILNNLMKGASDRRRAIYVSAIQELERYIASETTRIEAGPFVRRDDNDKLRLLHQLEALLDSGVERTEAFEIVARDANISVKTLKNYLSDARRSHTDILSVPTR